MLLVPVLWLILFGYAATFDVKEFRGSLVDAAGNTASADLVDALKDEGVEFKFDRSTEAAAKDDLETGRSVIALFITEPRGDDAAPGSTQAIQADVFIDGANIVQAQGAARAVQKAVQSLRPPAPRPGAGAPRAGATAPQALVIPDIEILYNPDLKSADFMIPGLIGMIILFVGGLMTSLGVVRERERGTLEQLVATPLRPFEMVIGKVAPYALLALIDLIVVVLLGIYVFGVPFRGSFAVFVPLACVYLLSALAIGLLVSSVSRNQQQAMQTSVFILFPQFLLSGIIFPLEAIPLAIRWISYLLPLTYFVPIARGVMLKGVGLDVLWPYAAVLAVFSVVLLSAAAMRFRIRGL